MAEGALKGAKTAAQEWLKKTVFCFAKGTLIWTTVGLKYDKSGNMIQEITTDKNDDLAFITGEYHRKIVNYEYDKQGSLITIGSPRGERECFEYYAVLYGYRF